MGSWLARSDLQQNERSLLEQALEPLDLIGRLRATIRFVEGRIVFTTSFGLEDQAIAHAIFSADLDEAITVATLDTGRHFEETYEVWAETERRYGRRIRSFSPSSDAAEALVAAQGVNGFRESIEARQACCVVRKVEPLRRALQGSAGWITGLRAEQSRDRAATPLVDFDETHSVLKINPLVDWTRADVASYVADHAIPYNRLHDRGFPSIGCAPCTRAVRVGEPERAGRWWWEEAARKECGLHVTGAQQGDPAAWTAATAPSLEPAT